jgi:hypothetical protein
MRVECAYLFRVTRNAETAQDEEEVTDVVEMISSRRTASRRSLRRWPIHSSGWWRTGTPPATLAIESEPRQPISSRPW